MPSILIADMHPIFAFGLQAIAKQIFPTAKVDIMPKNMSLEQRLVMDDYDIFILDIRWNNHVTPSLIGQLLHHVPKLKILLLDNHTELEQIRTYFKRGIIGYMDRNAPQIEFRTAIETIGQGKPYIKVELLISLLLLNPDFLKNSEKGFVELTDREQQVASLILIGKKTSEICKKLGLKPSTVSTHKFNIYKKMDVATIDEMWHKAEFYGIHVKEEQVETENNKPTIPLSILLTSQESGLS